MRFEFVRMRPGDHMGWAFTGAREFAALATSCLMEGAALGERVMYVAEHPDPSAVAALTGITGEGDLQIVSLGDVYGTSGVVDPEAQLACYAAELEAALAAGYSGLRIVSDNTPLVLTEAGLAAWRRYELIGDQFAATHQATALCAFDAQRLDAGRLAQLAAMHPLSSASGPVPPYRLYFEGSTLRLDGPLTATSVASLRRALGDLPAGTPAAVDLGADDPEAGAGGQGAGEPEAAASVSGDVIAMLNELADAGTPVTVLGQAAALRAVRAAVPPPSEGLVLRHY